jgi:hypothetical protein
LNLLRYFLESNEFKKKLDQLTSDQIDLLQKYNDLQTKSAKEKAEIKIEFDSKINKMKTEFDVKFDKKGMTLKKCRTF